MNSDLSTARLGASITRAASLQTYYTVRFLVDRELVEQAYQAYAYFRWVDDWLDEPSRPRLERAQFVSRQQALIDACYRGQAPRDVAPQERMLVELVARGDAEHSGLEQYIRNMMSVMAFDAERRGRLISAQELDDYQHRLAVAVTEALHYFIGHNSASPHGPVRYLAVEAAHIVHMLRDTVEDVELGYFNVPREVLKAHALLPHDIRSAPYREWVCSRVRQARSYFRAGRNHLSQVESRRCRLAGLAYMARFEAVLDAIEREGYLLRPAYRERKTALGGALMGWSVLRSALGERPAENPHSVFSRKSTI